MKGGRGGGACLGVGVDEGPTPVALARRFVDVEPGAGRGRARDRQGHGRVVELSQLQQTVARRMAESKATAPHFYLQAEIDMTRCVEARGRMKAAAARGRGGPVVQRHGGQGVRARAG